MKDFLIDYFEAVFGFISLDLFVVVFACMLVLSALFFIKSAIWGK